MHSCLMYKYRQFWLWVKGFEVSVTVDCQFTPRTEKSKLQCPMFWFLQYNLESL